MKSIIVNPSINQIFFSHPFSIVAAGAAIQAAILDQVDSNNIQDMVLNDVTPISLGIAIWDGVQGSDIEMAFIVRRNTRIPASVSEMFTTNFDGQKSIQINVYEGEDMLVENNNLLGTFELSGIDETLKANEAEIKVTFDIDYDGILNVTALDLGTSNQRTIKIVKNTGGLTITEIDCCVDTAKKFDTIDEAKNQFDLAKNELLSYCYGVLTIFNDQEASQQVISKVPEADRNSFTQKISLTISWLNGKGSLSTAEIKKRHKELEATYKSLKISEN